MEKLETKFNPTTRRLGNKKEWPNLYKENVHYTLIIIYAYINSH